ncbi:hypothetical protein BT96DRAFT_920721 [Gymnopus androsaceus JB14]|uniref:Uncharacterized protein n=1 Tax=Gymnopus androsaceus JB14 TaxID=1447944 RepID=A0A6A4HKJ5_9AGAR|nr:hypothetical protein BT96DRAFT_920721 [Gymnopus androsaceus JB14]
MLRGLLWDIGTESIRSMWSLKKRWNPNCPFIYYLVGCMITLTFVRIGFHEFCRKED